LTGQFAIALWDSTNKRLVLARDRVGKKPLFYTVAGNTLVFASEIKAILLHPDVRCRVDYRCLDQLFTFFMPVNPRTMFDGIQNLPPGRLIDVQNGQVRVHKYWESPVPDLSSAQPLCILVQAKHELGIEPNFGAEFPVASQLPVLRRILVQGPLE
jgi:asparagine synthase (glutamine-hydrolysing)